MSYDDNQNEINKKFHDALTGQVIIITDPEILYENQRKKQRKRQEKQGQTEKNPRNTLVLLSIAQY